ncbi:hypothetical protein ACA910_021006 [Epithemia clementina (nom. ined.)]
MERMCPMVLRKKPSSGNRLLEMQPQLCPKAKHKFAWIDKDSVRTAVGNDVSFDSDSIEPWQKTVHHVAMSQQRVSSIRLRKDRKGRRDLLPPDDPHRGSNTFAVQTLFSQWREVVNLHKLAASDAEALRLFHY